MIALVLAAGFGTRFRPDTLTTPKPLLPFCGRPILFHLFDHLLSEGVERFVVNSHHLAEALEKTVGRSYRGVPVSFSREEEILGTAGAIRHAADSGLLGDADFLVVNGDLFTTIQLSPLIEAATSGNALSTMAVLPNRSPERETPLWGDGGRFLSGVGEKPDAASTGPWLFSGVQLASRVLVERIPPGRSELARDILLPSVAIGERAFRLVPCEAETLWFDLGSPERLARAEAEVMKRLRSPSRPSAPHPTRRSGPGTTTG